MILKFWQFTLHEVYAIDTAELAKFGTEEPPGGIICY
jgi:hypothetical protein